MVQKVMKSVRKCRASRRFILSTPLYIRRTRWMKKLSGSATYAYVRVASTERDTR